MIPKLIFKLRESFLFFGKMLQKVALRGARTSTASSTVTSQPVVITEEDGVSEQSHESTKLDDSQADTRSRLAVPAPIIRDSKPSKLLSNLYRSVYCIQYTVC